MLLTADQQRDVARRAIWYFDCFFGALSEDSVVFTGDGVEDLDRLISRLTDNAAQNKMPHQKFMCDVGTQYSEWRPFDLDDLVAIRAQFVTSYGNVNRPDVYATRQSGAVSVSVISSGGGSSPEKAD